LIKSYNKSIQDIDNNIKCINTSIENYKRKKDLLFSMLDNVSSEINEIKDIKIADLEISNFNSLLKYLQSYKENFGNDKI